MCGPKFAVEKIEILAQAKYDGAGSEEAAGHAAATVASDLIITRWGAQGWPELWIATRTSRVNPSEKREKRVKSVAPRTPKHHTPTPLCRLGFNDPTAVRAQQTHVQCHFHHTTT